jgi:hypothetical protein
LPPTGIPGAMRRAKLRALKNAEEDAEEICKELGCPGATVSATIDEYYRFFRMTVLITPRDGSEPYMDEFLKVKCDVTVSATCPKKPESNDTDKSKRKVENPPKTIAPPADAVQPATPPPTQPPPPPPPRSLWSHFLEELWKWVIQPAPRCNPQETDVEKIRKAFPPKRVPEMPPREAPVPGPGPK